MMLDVMYMPSGNFSSKMTNTHVMYTYIGVHTKNKALPNTIFTLVQGRELKTVDS